MKSIFKLIEKYQHERRLKRFRRKYFDDSRLVNIVEFNGKIYLSVNGQPVVNVSDLNKEREVTDILKDSRDTLSNFIRMRI